jgi:hypothetical protein
LLTGLEAGKFKIKATADLPGGLALWDGRFLACSLGETKTLSQIQL